MNGTRSSDSMVTVHTRGGRHEVEYGWGHCFVTVVSIFLEPSQPDEDDE